MVDPEYIRSLIRATPFLRFTLITNDGIRVEVKRPGTMGMDSEGNILLVPDAAAGYRTLPTSCVKEVIVEPPASPQTSERIETIRQLRNAAPFIPFAVIVDDGRKLVVDRSYRIGISPGGREICYAVSPVDFQRIPSSRVKEVLRDAG